jgi:hypothetical protein
MMSNKHYVLLRETAWAGPTAVQRNEEDWDFLSGTAVQTPPALPNYVLRVEKGVNPKDYPPCDLHDATSGQLLMSPKLVTTLTDAGVTNLQYFDCQVVYEPTGQHVPYKLANIIGAVKALDVAASDCVVDEDGFVETFRTMKLDERQASGFDLFRLYEALPMVIISERLKHLLEAANITGIRIIEDTEWEPGLM